MKFIVKVLILAIVALGSAYLIPEIRIASFGIAVFVILVISFLNVFVKPILVVLTIPVTIFTFGLFLLVINALIIMIATWLVPGFEVNGFWWAILFSLILSLANYILESINAD